MADLFTDFEKVSPETWNAKIIKDLKGVPYESLIFTDEAGNIIKPFYTKEDFSEASTSLPSNAGWDACVTIKVEDEKKSNNEALEALKLGASGLIFQIDKKINLSILLKDISVENIYCEFSLTNDSLALANELAKYEGKKNAFDNKYKTHVNIDPIYLFEKYGEWHTNKESDFEVIKERNHLSVNASLYHEAGANYIHEISYCLAHLNEYLNYLSPSELKKLQYLHLTLNISSAFFTEIIKISAIRELCRFLISQYNIDLPIHLHINTALINKSNLDSYNNLLRSTTEAMSAIIGNADSLCICPFNVPFETSDNFSNRMAINQHHILKHESYLDKTINISSGSYFIETKIKETCEKAWNEFKEIEKKGGLIELLKNNFIQREIENDFNMFIESLNKKERIIIGVNQYINSNDKPLKKYIETKEVKGKEIEKLYQRIYVNHISA